MEERSVIDQMFDRAVVAGCCILLALALIIGALVLPVLAAAD